MDAQKHVSAAIAHVRVHTSKPRNKDLRTGKFESEAGWMLFVHASDLDDAVAVGTGCSKPVPQQHYLDKMRKRTASIQLLTRTYGAAN